MNTTRTIGPLHLEDLDPHRFEDLIRQLIYDFRRWRALEATGRGGSDDGFDARAIEVVQRDEDPTPLSEEEDYATGESEERVWLVQCKREKTINPKKLLGYLDNVSPSARAGLYGIVFAAACDFSKKARDAFRDKARELGYSEAYLWGKGEIEDMLFQPKNDHLLFAYIGISLQTRRRSLKTEVRARIATKRKCKRALTPYQMVLIRDASDMRYPFLDPDNAKQRGERGRWGVRRFEGVHHDGLHFQYARHFAYLSDDGQQWDYAECMNDARAATWEDPWLEGAEDSGARSRAVEIWNALPEGNRAWLEFVAVLPFDRIVSIDEDGDDWTGIPHIYTEEFPPDSSPYLFFTKLETVTRDDSRRFVAGPERLKRVAVFPIYASEKKSKDRPVQTDERL